MITKRNQKLYEISYSSKSIDSSWRLPGATIIKMRRNCLGLFSYCKGLHIIPLSTVKILNVTVTENRDRRETGVR